MTGDFFKPPDTALLCFEQKENEWQSKKLLQGSSVQYKFVWADYTYYARYCWPLHFSWNWNLWWLTQTALKMPSFRVKLGSQILQKNVLLFISSEAWTMFCMQEQFCNLNDYTQTILALDWAHLISSSDWPKHLYEKKQYLVIT